MAIKVYLDENYLIVEEANIYGEGLAKDVRVQKLYVNIPDGAVQRYSFTNVNNIGSTYDFRDENGDVLFQKQNGDPYNDEAEFETFYKTSTGKSSGGDTPPTSNTSLVPNFLEGAYAGFGNITLPPDTFATSVINKSNLSTFVQWYQDGADVVVTDGLGENDGYWISALTYDNVSPPTELAYIALISQSGTSAPTVDRIIKNTIGTTPVWDYIDIGQYGLTATNKFNENTYCPQNGIAFFEASIELRGAVHTAERIDSDTFNLFIYNADNNEYTDNALNQFLIEIYIPQ